MILTGNGVRGGSPASGGTRSVKRAAGRAVRTGPARVGCSSPGGAPLRYRGAWVVKSTAPHPISTGPHRREPVRPISPGTTVLLAVIAAGITLWLGLMADFGAALAGSTSAVPERLAVVQIHQGESLAHLAARVDPDAPAGEVVERIRELNKLESVSVNVGQTLIAPVG